MHQGPLEGNEQREADRGETDRIELYRALTSKIMHDLKAPIRQINQLSEMVRSDHQDTLDEDALSILSLIQTKSRELNARVDAIRHISDVVWTPVAIKEIDIVAWMDQFFAAGLPIQVTGVSVESTGIHLDPALLGRLFDCLFGGIVSADGAQSKMSVDIVFQEQTAAGTILRIGFAHIPIETKEKLAAMQTGAFHTMALELCLCCFMVEQICARTGWYLDLSNLEQNLFDFIIHL